MLVIKRISCMLMILLLLVYSIPFSISARDDSAFWPLYYSYQDAKSSGTPWQIIEAGQKILDFYSVKTCEDDYIRCLDPAQRIARNYEKMGYFPAAAQYYNEYLKLITYLDDNGTDWKDMIKIVKATISHLSVTPKTYVETSDISSVPYFGAVNEPRYGVFFGMCDHYVPGKQTAYLQYVQFEDESLADHVEGTNKDDLASLTEGTVLEIAWNMPDEKAGALAILEYMVNGSFDSYIISNLKTMKSFSDRGISVLCRLAAEVNCWIYLDTIEGNAEKRAYFISTYINAFRHISDLRKIYAPDVAMVYSPNDIYNWYYSPLDFYPGDEYVDWVGVTSYLNMSRQSREDVATDTAGVNAVYSTGAYDNQLIKIKETVDAFKDRKPILISEGGYAYASSDGLQNQQYATEKLTEFYSYINLVYPQVKAILYFNVNMNSDVNKYELYGSNGNADFAAVYENVINNNAGMKASMSGEEARAYSEVTSFSEKTDGNLKFRTYADYPTTQPTTVKYYIDGVLYKQTSAAPYDAVIDVYGITDGVHELKIVTACLNTVHTQSVRIMKFSNGLVRTAFNDISGHWAENNIITGVGKGYFDGVSKTEFMPENPVTRAMVVTVLYRMNGSPEFESFSDFTDVDDGLWYSDAVSWASGIGIVNGYDDGTFLPNNNISREEMCTLFARSAYLFNIELTNYDTSLPFADHGEIGQWAVQSVYACKNASLVNGKGNNIFAPKATATRAEFATIINNFCNMYS